MHELADAQLLRAYAQQGDQAAFRELVTRYSDLVYSAALRQVNSPDPARDIAQSVFTDLALKARTLADKLPTDGSLAGWLHRSTRFAVLNLLRDVRRRRENERQAMEQLRTNSEPEPEWDGIRPVLDEALDSLDDEDRDALLLRFFKNHDFRTIGAALGVSDDTAQKRVSRALDRLRAEFNRRGVTTSAVALTAALSANAVAAGPAGLAATLSSAALTSSTLASTATATATKAIAMTTLQKTLITAIVVATVVTPLVVQHQAQARLREQNDSIRERASQLAELQAENESLSNKLAQATSPQSLPDDQFRELLRLRGEVGRLRRDVQETSQPKTNAPMSREDMLASKSKLYSDRVSRLKQLLDANTSEKIPELQLLNDRDWLKLVDREMPDTDEGRRRAMCGARNQAVIGFGMDMVYGALRKYGKANNGRFPTELAQLKPYFKSPVDDAILERWEILPAKQLDSRIRPDEEWVITPKAPVNQALDQTVVIGMNTLGLGAGTNQWARLR